MELKHDSYNIDNSQKSSKSILLYHSADLLTVMVQHAFRSMDTYRTEDSDRFTNVQKFTNSVYAT